ncbi:YbaB/EbfC family DNA-binding protein [Amycolatopsis sp. Hca4]|uniref:YbaB/EbfC family DNA-binding protein n=1 Tax=Amycolatopsis sp. Hca4 TaxID=2742131 RepID=UPI001591FCFB|nr:YbaB/EbfC family DNA-binding protein [Amycolatopsis sp. Hca4]QKV74010.1 YbaB/EbfC family DNA-binding protein [Amycolatopsis sp. Hca4]
MMFPDGLFDGGGVEEAMAALQREREKLDKLSALWRDGRTTVRAKDQSLSMTFDGRGELVEMAFNEGKYRSLAPAQLASVVVETLQRGKAESMAKVAELMGTGSTSGLDYGAVASGKADPRELLDSLISPMLDSVGVPRADRGERNG